MANQPAHLQQPQQSLTDLEPPPEPSAREPGAILVDAAIKELAKISPPSIGHQRRQQPSVLSTIIHFVADAIPRLTASAPPSPFPPPPAKTELDGPLAEAVRLLTPAATLHNNSDALYLLAEMNFYGNYSHPRDLAASLRFYRQLAATHSNSTAQFMLGVLYGTGLGGKGEVEQGAGLIAFDDAAERGDTRAQMALGFRLSAGIGAPRNCEQAITYYKAVADKAMAWYRSGPPLGPVWVQENWRIADDDGGVYGHGASASSAGLSRASVHSDANAAIEDVIEYLDLVSQKGDSKATLNLGRLYYEGQHGLDRDLEQATRHFFMVAKRYWKKDGRVLENHKPGVEKAAGRAAGFLGRMYLRGEAFEQNFEKARMWFERGDRLKDAQSQHGLGLMLLHGWGGPADAAAAFDQFRYAADQYYAPAQVELARIHLDLGSPEDVRLANNYVELATRHGNIEALYFVAEMIHAGVGRDRNCNTALAYYKSVAEKAEPLVSSWAQANKAYEDGDLDTALVHFVVAAEQGYERAQNNAAYMMDASRSLLDRLVGYSGIGSWWWHDERRAPLLKDAALALIYWTRSSRQSNIDATVKMGDYYHHGIGTAEPDPARAVQCYSAASEFSQSAQALWNLGWMHENGVGLMQDFHLAKRYYDQALAANEEAYLPVTLSLLKLRMRSAWNTLTGGSVHSIRDEPSKWGRIAENNAELRTADRLCVYDRSQKGLVTDRVDRKLSRSR